MMLRSLRSRIIAGFLVVMVITIALLSVTSSRVTTAQFDTYMQEGRQAARDDIVRTLADYYADGRSWSGVQPEVERLAVKYENRIVLWDAGSRIVAQADERAHPGGSGGGGMMRMMGGARGTIEVDGRGVGLVGYSAPMRIPSLAGPESGFIAGVNRYLLLGGILAALLAIVLGAGLAQRLTSPLKDLTAAVRRMAGGQLDQRVEVRATEEVEELADAFNSMAANLAQAQELRRNLMTDVAHELRTPITSMQVHLEGVMDGAVPLSPETIELLHGETLLLAGLVEELRDLSLAEAGQLRLDLEPVDLAEIVRREAKVLAPRFERADVALKLDIPDGLGPVNGDRGRLVQVLRNLLDNALSHTPAEGTVSVSLRPEAGDLTLSVSDTGPGIQPDDLPFVFERFYRAQKATEGGSGIGLTIAKRLVEAHHGTIQVKSEPGAGTQMIAKFPARLPG